MTRHLLRLAIASAVLVPVFATAPAHAQATRTWVSGVGDDANPCSRTAPCKTFAGAISKTAASGEINCLDPGGFGGVTITKNLTIACDYTEGGILASLTNGVNVNAAGIFVVLRGLDIEGAGNGLIGVNIINAARVVIEKSIIHGFRGGSATGILVNVSGNTRVMVSDTNITDNGNGISMTTTGAGTAQLAADNIRVSGNSLNGFTVGPNTAATITRSVFAFNGAAGVQVGAGNGTINLTGSIVQNNTTGVNVASATGRIRVADNDVHNNTTGFAFVAGGVIESANNNRVGDNGGGGPNGTITQQ
jgi:hypothetical protein